MADVLRATYADLKTVKTRSTCQVILEMPIEALTEVVGLLGAPVPGETVWVAIARIRPEGTKPAPQLVEDKSTPTRTLAQSAAFLGTRQTFRAFIAQKQGTKELLSDHDVKHYIYELCGITSRTELNTNPIAARIFTDLRADYRNWLAGVDPLADADEIVPTMEPA